MSLVIALACVVLATVGVRASTADAEADIVRATVGEAAVLNEGEVTVQPPAVCDALLADGVPTYRTSGMFVVLRVTAAATGAKPVRLDAVRLVTDELRYEPYASSSGVRAKPGFRLTTDLVFEVDPARITGLTLQLGTREVVSGYQQRLDVDLGITADTAEEWRSRARGAAREPNDGSPVVIS